MDTFPIYLYSFSDDLYVRTQSFHYQPELYIDLKLVDLLHTGTLSYLRRFLSFSSFFSLTSYFWAPCGRKSSLPPPLHPCRLFVLTGLYPPLVLLVEQCLNSHLSVRLFYLQLV